MKILLICGTLEAGKDGVGDYTSRLAKEITQLGQETKIISIHDKYIHGIIDNIFLDGNNKISVTRISNRIPAYRFKNILSKKILAFDPDWISIQYVPFSFHNKGLPFFVHQVLHTVLKSRKIHIMFHELWIGSYGSVSVLNKIIGSIQKLMIQSFLNDLNPAIITTTNEVYKRKLLPFNALNLPLFGNIPISKKNNSKNKDKKNLDVVVFGNMTTNYNDFFAQVSWLVKLGAKFKQNVKMHFLGNIRNLSSDIIHTLNRLLGVNNVIQVGSISATELSDYLSSMDFGISKADAIFFYKSGSTIAILEHGLPVLLRGERPFNFSPLYFEDYTKQLFFVSDNVPEALPILIPHSNIHEITEQYLTLLSMYDHL